MDSLFDPNVSATDWLWSAAQQLAAWRPEPGWEHSPNVPLVGLLFVALLMICFGGRKRQSKRRPSRNDDDDEVHRDRNTPLLELDIDWWRPWRSELSGRLWWKVRPPHDIMRVDGLVINRTGKRSHCAWYAPTGGGKSSAVAVLRLDGARPTLAPMPDKSDPIIASAKRLGDRGFIWTACESEEPIDFLIGSPEQVAERLSTVFDWGGTGAWMRRARLATARVIHDMDDLGRDRWLMEVGLRLEQMARKDKTMEMVLGGWIARFLDVAVQFGPSMAPGGRDLVAMLRQGMTVVLDVEAMAHPSLGGDVVAFGLAEGKRCAPHVPGGFRIVFEEAGQLGERIKLADPFHRAGRRHKIAVDDLTQAETDLVMKGGNNGIVANLGLRVYFSQEEVSLQKLAANRLGLKHTALDPGNLKDYHAYVVSGRVRRLVRFPKPPELWTPPARKTGCEDRYEPGSYLRKWEEELEQWTGTEGTGTQGSRTRVVDVTPREEKKPWDTGVIMLPGASAQIEEHIVCPSGGPGECTDRKCHRCRRMELWGNLDGTWNEHGDHVWQRGTVRGVYGKTSYLNVAGWQTHFLFWAWKVLWDHELGVAGDLERFFKANPDVPRFEWPVIDDELVVLRALKTWMQRPDPGRTKLSLSVDHCCPGGPNSLCGNWRHHQLVADEPGREGSNSDLRWKRRKGLVHD